MQLHQIGLCIRDSPIPIIAFQKKESKKVPSKFAELLFVNFIVEDVMVWKIKIYRKYPLRGYILRVLTHTAACDRFWRGNVISELYISSLPLLHSIVHHNFECVLSPLKHIWHFWVVKFSVSVTFFGVTGQTFFWSTDRTSRYWFPDFSASHWDLHNPKSNWYYIVFD